MYQTFQTHLNRELAQIRAAGLEKNESIIIGPQGARIVLSPQREVINLCSNNYLGLAGDPRIAEAAKAGIDRYGYGLSSVRFICGTQKIHKELEASLADFLKVDDAILYGSCFDANGGVFSALLADEDAVISDELNHASIIDGIRLCKARRLRYRNCDMADLEAQLKASASARFRLIVTDGVFSMDGKIACLSSICDLAERYGALVMVDDSHATGFIGKQGRGTPEFCGVEGRIDLLSGTFGKALGGGSGGYIAGRKEMIAMLRQRSRPYLFSNSIPPAVAGASLKALEMVRQYDTQRSELMDKTLCVRKQLTKAGFSLIDGIHPIIPIMLYDAHCAQSLAAAALERGVYVTAFAYPVVPEGKARIRLQISAAHTREDLERAVQKLTEAALVVNL